MNYGIAAKFAANFENYLRNFVAEKEVFVGEVAGTVVGCDFGELRGYCGVFEEIVGEIEREISSEIVAEVVAKNCLILLLDSLHHHSSNIPSWCSVTKSEMYCSKITSLPMKAVGKFELVEKFAERN